MIHDTIGRVSTMQAELYDIAHDATTGRDDRADLLLAAAILGRVTGRQPLYEHLGELRSRWDRARAAAAEEAS